MIFVRFIWNFFWY